MKRVRMNIIGLSGFAGSGKDSVAALMVQNYNYCRIALADPIKRFVKDVWDIDENSLWGESKLRNIEDPRYPTETGFLSPRKILQDTGNNQRDLYKDIWTEYSLRVAKQILADKKYDYSPIKGLYVPEGAFQNTYVGVVISDGRFFNELNAVKKEGGKLVKIKRNNAGLTGAAALHSSETEMATMPDDYFDYILDNNGTIQELDGKVNEMMHSISR